MGTERLSSPTARRRAVGIAIGATVVLVVLVVGLTFANSVGAARVAGNASDLHWTNATLGTGALTRAAVVQATTFSELAGSGLVTPDDLSAAMGEARDARDRLAELLEASGWSDSTAALTHFLARMDEALAHLDNGDVRATIDTRSLYAAALDWLGGDAQLSDDVLAGSFDRHDIVHA